MIKFALPGKCNSCWVTGPISKVLLATKLPSHVNSVVVVQKLWLCLTVTFLWTQQSTTKLD